MQIQFPFCHHDTKGVASAHEDDFGVRVPWRLWHSVPPEQRTMCSRCCSSVGGTPRLRRGKSENPCGSPGVSDPSPDREKASAGVSAVVP